MALYDPAEDTEYQDYLERSKSLSNPVMSDRHSCLPCGKLNLSLEYYNNHINGRAHKMKMIEMKKEEKGSKSGKGVQRTHVRPHVKTTHNGKVVKEGSVEEDFFQFF